MKDSKKLEIGTLAIHGGQEPDPSTGAIMTPIYQTSTYAQTSPGVHKGYDYSRTDNPTRRALEKSMASLERASYGISFSSGMAAISSILQMLKSGDHVVCSDDVYGGTFRIFDKIYKNFGLKFDFVDTSDVSKIKSALKPETRMLWIETPTNPTLKITDICGGFEYCQINRRTACG